MKWRVFLELFLPTIVLGTTWFVVSQGTTIYISWLEDERERVLRENIPCVQAAAQMQNALWNLHPRPSPQEGVPYLTPEEERTQREAAMQSFLNSLQVAETAASTKQEREVVAEIRRLFSIYQAEVEQGSGNGVLPTLNRGLARVIAEQCIELMEINQQLLVLHNQAYANWSPRIGWTRLMITTLGPLVGLWLGFRTAGRVQRRIAEISVSLEDATVQLGQVEIPMGEDADLEKIDLQTQAIVTQIKKVVAELGAARQEALRNERLAAVGHLAAGVAHELRNPLTAVKLLVQVAAQKARTSGWNEQQLTVIQDEIARMERTIQGLLDFARPPSSQRFQIDVREIVQRALNLIHGRAARDSVQIEWNSGDEPFVVLGDPEQLHQVIVNLLLNGMDAMPHGGTLHIDVAVEPAKSAENGSPGQIVIRVRDQGRGISQEVLEHIFEPFVTTKSHGVGLGLAVSRRIVEEHHGQLAASNAPAGGAEFAITLPLCATEAVHN